MLGKYIALIVDVLAAAAIACKFQGGGHGDACFDSCQSDMVCEKGTCRCPYPLAYSRTLQKCSIAPGYGESCFERCQSDLSCVDGICQCHFSSQVYNVTLNRCSVDPIYGESCTDRCQSEQALECVNGACQCPYNMKYDTTEKKCTQILCKTSRYHTVCRELKDGHYPFCVSFCEQGEYIKCVNRLVVVMACDYAWYAPPVSKFLKKVYDPYLDRCVMESSYCPRDLDKMIQ